MKLITKIYNKDRIIDDEIMKEDNTEMELDTNWANDFLSIEKEYDKFYKIEPLSIKCFYIYVENDMIVSLKEDNLLLNNGIVKESILLFLINKNKSNVDLKNKYRLFKLLKFNIDIENDFIDNIFSEEYIDILNLSKLYFSEIDDITDIKFNDTISILQDINCLFFIFKKIDINIKSIKTNLNKTKKIKKKTNMTAKTMVKRT